MAPEMISAIQNPNGAYQRNFGFTDEIWNTLDGRGLPVRKDLMVGQGSG
jgi:hypothetical protein